MYYFLIAPYVSLLRKDLPSPLGQDWEATYAYRLLDTVLVGGIICYRINYEPRKIEDLAFNGTVWIDTTHHGFLKIEANINRRVNINFVEAIRLEQYWEDVEGSNSANPVRLPPCLPNFSLIQIALYPTRRACWCAFTWWPRIRKSTNPQEPGFYDPALELAENYRQSTPDYWKQVRLQQLTADELRVLEVVGSVRNTPVMRTMGKVIDLLNGGYLPLGTSGLELGPLIHSYANNTLEGNRFRLGILGRTSYRLNLGYTPSTLPYSLLFIPKGNQSLFYSTSGYNPMSQFEFGTDRFAGLMFEHNFQGLILNRIPAIRRLKWRLLVSGKALVGGVSYANVHSTPIADPLGLTILGFQSLSKAPYAELGYGIHNIFKVLRIDAIHRLTYRDSPDAINFGIKVSSGLSF